MEIKISGNPKEIADLALALQNRQTVNLECDSREFARYIMKGIRAMNESESQIFGKEDFTSAQKIITEASKKVHEEKSIPKYETREFHIFCGNTTDSNSKSQPVKKRTFEDVKRNFQKMLELIKTMEGSEMPSPFRKENT